MTDCTRVIVRRGKPSSRFCAEPYGVNLGTGMNYVATDFWNESTIKKLRNLRDAGLSAAQIGESLGTSRNAVLGKIKRLGLANSARVFWTADIIAETKKLFADGYSISLIAEKIGATKNATVSKLERLGLLGKGREVKFTKRESGQARRIYRPRINIRLEDTPRPNEQFKCDLFGLVNDTCRWPLWDDYTEGPKFYCGTLEADCKEGKPYCRWHTAIATRPVPPRTGAPFL